MGARRYGISLRVFNSIAHVVLFGVCGFSVYTCE